MTAPGAGWASSPGYWDGANVSLVYRSGVTRTSIIGASRPEAAVANGMRRFTTLSRRRHQAVQLRLGRPADPGPPELNPGWSSQVGSIVLVLAAQNAVPANLAHRMPVGEFRVGNVARGAVGPLAPGASVTLAVAGSLPGLGTRFQNCDHDRRLPFGLRPMCPPRRTKPPARRTMDVGLLRSELSVPDGGHAVRQLGVGLPNVNNLCRNVAQDTQRNDPVQDLVVSRSPGAPRV